MLIHGDCLVVLPTLESESIDACVTDPPYGLSFMDQRWDHGVPGIDFWSAVLRVLKPGAHLLAFGGTRTYHRMACAVEDAGFEIRDQLQWLYGSGFPKSHNLKGDWQGFGTALKPANEPIVLARKPFTGTVAANVAQYGCGALNVDGCRIPLEEGVSLDAVNRQQAANPIQVGGAKPGDVIQMYKPGGRWPANVLLDEEAAALLDGQTGDRPGYATQRHLTDSSDKSIFGVSASPDRDALAFNDSGGASRFFYCAKASRRERNAGLEGMEERGSKRYGERGQGALPQQTPQGDIAHQNHHPTVKPLSLMRYLCHLVTPPGGIVLDPFTGSGTTGCAAVLEGFDFIGIEREVEYVEIARRRIEHMQAQQLELPL